MNPAWCALCLGQVSGRSPLVEDVFVSDPFPARYRGRCEECLGDISVGEFVCRIQKHSDDNAVVVHEDCVTRDEYYAR